jgi:hypothetical protein
MSRHKGSDCRAFVSTVTEQIANAKKAVGDIDSDMNFWNATERVEISRLIEKILETLETTSTTLNRSSFYDYRG